MLVMNSGFSAKTYLTAQRCLTSCRQRSPCQMCVQARESRNPSGAVSPFWVLGSLKNIPTESTLLIWLLGYLGMLVAKVNSSLLPEPCSMKSAQVVMHPLSLSTTRACQPRHHKPLVKISIQGVPFVRHPCLTLHAGLPKRFTLKP